jgi:hypothetical protein
VTPDLEKLEALAKAATPGPWFVAIGHSVCVISNKKGQSIFATTCAPYYKPVPEGGLDNASFAIGANPQTILALIARVRELEAALKPFADIAAKYDADFYGREVSDDFDTAWDGEGNRVGDLRNARRTLKGTP